MCSTAAARAAGALLGDTARLPDDLAGFGAVDAKSLRRLPRSAAAERAASGDAVSRTGRACPRTPRWATSFREPAVARSPPAATGLAIARLAPADLPADRVGAPDTLLGLRAAAAPERSLVPTRLEPVRTLAERAAGADFAADLRGPALLGVGFPDAEVLPAVLGLAAPRLAAESPAARFFTAAFRATDLAAADVLAVGVLALDLLAPGLRALDEWVADGLLADLRTVGMRASPAGMGASTARPGEHEH